MSKLVKGMYKKMPGGNRTGKPIIMENGKVINVNETVIESKAIEEGMEYVSRMTAGLATGVMAMDEEYCKLQKKIIADLIKEQAIETQKKIVKMDKVVKNKYANAYKVHEEVLDRMYEQSAQIAKDNSISFFVDSDDKVYKVSNSGPIGCVSKMSDRFEQINLKELKENIEERIAKREESKRSRGIAKEYVDADRKTKKKTTKKKTTKKKVKKTKAKKGDRK